nr:PREDICTED: DNA repair protein XRCC4-like [Paralichthys olivaceus]
MEMHTSVREMYVSSQPDSTYFLRVDWREQGLGAGFQLVLTDGQGAWRGEVSDAALCEEAEELEMQKERYIHDLQQALTGTESSITYSFTLMPSPPNHSSTVTLAYEKVQKDISVSAAQISLSHMKRYVGGKEALETELYSRFVLVLNEKKAKIRSLQETVSQLQESSSEGEKNKDSVKSDQTAAEEDEYGGSTDEEPEEVKCTAPSTLQTRDSSTPSPLDGSLKDITDVAPCRKRRFRHLKASDPALKRPNPETLQRKRSDSPAGSSKQQTPQCSSDAAAASSAAEDLFEDF